MYKPKPTQYLYINSYTHEEEKNPNELYYNNY